MKQRFRWKVNAAYYYALIAAVAAAIAYINTLKYDFVSDDNYLILQHPFVQNIRNWPRIFTSGHYHGIGGYRPLTTLSFALNYLVGGRNPIGYHLVNIVLHALNSALVCLLLRRMLLPRTAAFLGALIFALHPIHTEAVAWISGRSELLAAFFFLVAWLFHFRSRHVTALWSRPAVLSGVALFAALLSKENALIFPIVAMAGDIVVSRWQSHWDSLTGFNHWQRWKRLLLPSVAALVAYFGVRTMLYRRSIWRATADIQFIDNPLAHVPGLTRLLTALKVQVEYLSALLWPRGLCADYSFNSVPLVTGMNDPAVFVAAVVLALLLGIVAWSFFRNGRLWFGIVFYFVAVLPVANIFTAIGTIKAERFLYLPSFGFCFVAAIGAARLLQTGPALRQFTSPWALRLAAVIALALAPIAFCRTWQRNEVWQNEKTLWQSVVAVAPNNLKAQVQVGKEALTNGNHAGAVAAFRRALEIDPGSEDAVINLSAALMQDRQYPEAARTLEEAVSRYPDGAALHLNLGLAYLAMGRAATGIVELRRACELEPSNPGMRFNLALALSTTGDPQSAIGEYRHVLDVDPNYAEAWNGLGAALLKLHRNDEARDAFRRALILRPDYREAIYNMTLVDAPR